MLFDAQRPVALNGIEEIATRSDLLDRCLIVSLPAIPDDKRIDKQRFNYELNDARPRILGAVLEAVVAGIRNLPMVQLTDAPRMADFARWITAVEPGLGWSPGTLIKTYSGNRKNINQLALEASPIAAAVLEMDHYSGTASDLLRELESRVTDSVRKQEEWPRNARALSGALRRIAPNLVAIGVEVTFDREATTRRRRLISIRKRCGSTISTSNTVQTVRSAQESRPPRPKSVGISELRSDLELDANRVAPDVNERVVDTNPGAVDANRTDPSPLEIPPAHQLDDVDGMDAKVRVSPPRAPRDGSPDSSDAGVGMNEDDWETIE
jgi:hypothetical protein